MKDRASTNQSATRKLKEAPIGASPSWEDFCSHTLNNIIKLLLETINVTFTNKPKKLYQLIIQYKDKGRDLSRQVFGNIVCDSHGMIFGVNIEKIDQIIRNSCETIIIKISQPCNSNKWSEASSIVILESFVYDQKYDKLALEEF